MATRPDPRYAAPMDGWQPPAGVQPPGGPWPWPPGPAWQQQAAAAPPPAPGALNPRFLRGALVGAAVAYLVTNEQAQQATIRTLVRVRSMVQGGVEELKERFRDAEAELHAAHQHPDD